MRVIALLFAACAALFAAAAPVTASAQIEVDVNQGAVQPLPIAVPAFTGAQGAEIARVIAANLDRSGLFKPLDQASFPEHDLDIAVQPRLDAWKQIGAQALVNGRGSVDGVKLRHRRFREAVP